MKEIYYKINTDDPSKKKKIEDVLQDKRGWTKFGYKFIEALSPNDHSHILNISFLSNDELVRKFGESIRGLSCYVPSIHSIFFNETNWETGGQSGLPRDEYRTYVVNHEVGHALGLDHPYSKKELCRGKEGFVMLQMTKGPSVVEPCKMNIWPLDNEIKDGIRLLGGGIEASLCSCLMVVLALGLIYIAHIVCRNYLLSCAKNYDRTSYYQYPYNYTPCTRPRDP